MPSSLTFVARRIIYLRIPSREMILKLGARDGKEGMQREKSLAPFSSTMRSLTALN